MDDLVEKESHMKTDDLLKGVVAVVDCRSEGEDRSAAVAHQLELLGAVISRYFNKKVTHVLFHEGKQSTYDHAKRLGIPLMSIGWIDGCLQARGRVPEHLFRARIDACYEDPFVKPKNFRCTRPFEYLMCPELSAARLRRNRRQRELREHRRRLLDPTYQFSGETGDTTPDAHCRWMRDLPRINPTLILYDMSSDEDERDNTVPPPLTHRLLQKYPDSPILLEAYQRRERLKAESAAAAMAISPAPTQATSTPSPPSLVSLTFDSNPTEEALVTSDLTTPQRDNLLACSTSKTPKRGHEQAFSTSESEPESRLRVTCEGPEIVTSDTRKSIEEFKVIRKHKSKAKRLIFPSKLATPSSSCSSFTSFTEMVFTSFEPSEKRKFLLIIKRLGGFLVRSRVTDQTSHVICNGGRRTLNVLQGLVRGCWLLSPQWVSMSSETGRWIDETPYELSDRFPAAPIFRLQRAKSLSSADYRCDLFAEAGSIFVNDNAPIPLADLKQLLSAAGAQIVESVAEANIVIGGLGNVSFSWILDSITKHEVLPLQEYRINR